MESVWTVCLDWENMYNEWKTTPFTNIKPIDMEYESTALFKKMQKFSKDLKVRHNLLFIYTGYQNNIFHQMINFL